MPAKKRELKTNYIGLVSDETDQQYAANAQPRFGQPMKDYLRRLLAAVFERRGEARQSMIRKSGHRFSEKDHAQTKDRAE